MNRHRILLGISLLLVVVSIGVSLYLVHLHVLVHTDPSYVAGCDINATFRCSDVALSPLAVFLGLPVAVWALLGYVIFLFFLLRAFFSGGGEAAWRPGLYWVLNAVSLTVTVALACIAEMVLKLLCIGCAALYVTNTLLFVLATMILREHPGALRNDLTRLLPDRTLAAFAAGMLLTTLGVASAYPHYWEENGAPANGPAGVMVSSEWIGNPEAIVSITEFSDYQCPFCRRAHFRIRDLVQQHPATVRIRHKQFPLDKECNPALKRQLHAGSCRLARMAYCAGRQGKFWEMNDKLFRLPIHKKADPTALAKDLSLNIPAFLACMDSPEAKERIRKDIEEGLRLHISATPSFVIDGKVYKGTIPPTVLRRLGVQNVTTGRVRPGNRLGAPPSRG